MSSFAPVGVPATGVVIAVLFVIAPLVTVPLLAPVGVLGADVIVPLVNVPVVVVPLLVAIGVVVDWHRSTEEDVTLYRESQSLNSAIIVPVRLLVYGA